MVIFKPFQTFDDLYSIQFNHELVEDAHFKFTSSYNVVAARVAGVSYPDWIRYLISQGATIRGDGYCSAVFKNIEPVRRICQTLNEMWEVGSMKQVKNFDFAMEKAVNVYGKRAYFGSECGDGDAYVCPKCNDVIERGKVDTEVKKDGDDFICPFCGEKF